MALADIVIARCRPQFRRGLPRAAMRISTRGCRSMNRRSRTGRKACRQGRLLSSSRIGNSGTDLAVRIPANPESVRDPVGGAVVTAVARCSRLVCGRSTVVAQTGASAGRGRSATDGEAGAGGARSHTHVRSRTSGRARACTRAPATHVDATEAAAGQVGTAAAGHSFRTAALGTDRGCGATGSRADAFSPPAGGQRPPSAAAPNTAGDHRFVVLHGPAAPRDR